ncbi:MAG: hypothetical protein DI628_02455 [Blastochloris viridis]|uniref:Uncharacterized protein n=1 Tax=Blastochloris viridis TaxID=1079 RepID=A0A6N4RBU3_BLAVI|nr:MAG: hypothetical protein DI628_02455 [Blastochloris viridis]
MTQTANRTSQPQRAIPEEGDEPVHYTIDGTEEPSPQGRLVLVLEHELSEASRTSLHNVLKNIMNQDDVTMISGLSRASMLQAEQMGNGLFYNRKEYLSPEQAFRMLPWR